MGIFLYYQSTTNKSLFPYEHMRLQFSVLMSQMGRNEHGRPQLSRCPAIIMRPSSSYSIFISMLPDTSLIKRLQARSRYANRCLVNFWQNACLSLRSLARRPRFRAPGERERQPTSCFPMPLCGHLAFHCCSPLMFIHTAGIRNE